MTGVQTCAFRSRVRSHFMTWIKGEDVYKDIESASKYGLDFLVWIFWVQKQFDGMDKKNMAMKQLQKMWIYRRGYFYSKYDEFFETNEEELIKKGDLMNKIQFGFWKCIEGKGSFLKTDKTLVEILQELEKGEYRGWKGSDEMKNEFNKFLNEEKKKIFENEMNWGEKNSTNEEKDSTNEEKEGRKEFYQVIIKGKKEFKSNSPFYLTKDRLGLNQKSN